MAEHNHPVLHPLDEVLLTQQVLAVPGVIDAYRPAPIAPVVALPAIAVEILTGTVSIPTTNAVSLGFAEGHATIHTSIATSALSESTRIAHDVAEVLLAAADDANDPEATVHIQISRIS